MGYIKSGSELRRIDVMEREGLDESESRLFFVRYNGEFKLAESYSLYGKNTNDVEIVHKGVRLRQRNYSWYIYTDSGKLLDPKDELEKYETKQIINNKESNLKIHQTVQTTRNYSFNKHDPDDYDYDEPEPEPEPEEDYGNGFDVNLVAYPDGLDGLDDFDEIIVIDKHFTPHNNDYEINTDDDTDDYARDDHDAYDDYGD